MEILSAGNVLKSMDDQEKIQPLIDKLVKCLYDK